jgi:hypothetical protein
MVIEACECNWGIPGIDKLPKHHHYDRYDYKKDNVLTGFEFKREVPYTKIPDIKIWVNWKEIARYFSIRMDIIVQHDIALRTIAYKKALLEEHTNG